MVSKHGNEEQCQIIPNCCHDFSIKLIFPLIIPDYTFDYSQLFPMSPVMLIIEADP